MDETSDVTRVILELLAEGRSSDDVLRMRPYLTPEDLQRAARDALVAITAGPRTESRAERVERVRRMHPRAFDAWTEEEDSQLLRRFDQGVKVAVIARESGRPPGAIRTRLEKWLGPSWRERRLARAGDEE